MDKNQVDQLVIMYESKFPLGSAHLLKEKLQDMDFNSANILMAQLKDPTISIILSILVGSLGIDRIYIGDTALGIIKLITCGGGGLWWLIDLFLIMDATKQKNLQQISFSNF